MPRVAYGTAAIGPSAPLVGASAPPVAEAAVLVMTAALVVAVAAALVVAGPVPSDMSSATALPTSALSSSDDASSMLSLFTLIMKSIWLSLDTLSLINSRARSSPVLHQNV